MLPERSGAAPFDQHMARIDDAPGSLRSIVSDASENEPGNLLADQVSRWPDGCEGRDAGGAEIEVSEAHEGDVGRDGEALALALEQRAQGDQVVGAGDAVQVRNLSERAVQQQRAGFHARCARMVDDLA